MQADRRCDRPMFDFSKMCRTADIHDRPDSSGRSSLDDRRWRVVDWPASHTTGVAIARRDIGAPHRHREGATASDLVPAGAALALRELLTAEALRQLDPGVLVF